MLCVVSGCGIYLVSVVSGCVSGCGVYISVVNGCGVCIVSIVCVGVIFVRVDHLYFICIHFIINFKQ